MADFLESTSPAQAIKVADAYKNQVASSGFVTGRQLSVPEINLHCPTDICNGRRIFRYSEGARSIPHPAPWLTYIHYLCSNCRRTRKIFSLYVAIESESGESTSATCFKFGEHPPYGPPTPTRLLRLFGKDRDIFLKGRQCENHALGIGAFVYYRRVVESHKDQIIDEIAKVAEKVSPDLVPLLQKAKAENQFSNAVESIKNAIPQSLLINGQNPLMLLHKALSEGLHAQTDEECLELAHDVRVILAELAERIGQALKDEAELNAAITRLTARKQKDGS
jgi:hypothetical protein